MNNFFLSIDKMYLDSRGDQAHIYKVIRNGGGKIDGGSEYTIVFSFPDEASQIYTNNVLYRLGISADIVVNAN